MKSLFILVGPPNCGKGTQAEKLTEHLSAKHLIVSDLLKADPRGQEAITQAVLAGNDVVNPIVKSALEKSFRSTDTIVLDGACRTVNQARKVVDLASKKEWATHVISFNGFTDEILIARAHSRGRHDDIKIAERLMQFQKDTASAIRWLEGRTTSYRTINATKTVEKMEIEKDIDQIWSEVKMAIPRELRKKSLAVA